MSTSINTRNQLSFILAIVAFALFMTASVATAQFPDKSKSAAPAKSNPLVGGWVVTNHSDNQIMIEMNTEGQFRMQVNQQASGGTYKADDDSVTLNFSNGESQKFSWKRDGGQLSFQSENSGSTFVMKSLVKQRTGFDAVEDVREVPAAANPVAGTWYAHLVSGPINMLMKTEFNPDGTYKTVVLVKANGQKDTSTDTGNWKVQGSQLISRSNETQDQENMAFQIVNGNLVVDASKEFGTKITFYRNRDNVRPIQFDIAKLQEYYGDN